MCPSSARTLQNPYRRAKEGSIALPFALVVNARNYLRLDVRTGGELGTDVCRSWWDGRAGCGSRGGWTAPRSSCWWDGRLGNLHGVVLRAAGVCCERKYGEGDAGGEMPESFEEP